MAGSHAPELAELVAAAATADVAVEAVPEGDATVYAIGDSMSPRSRDGRRSSGSDRMSRLPQRGR